MTATDRSGSLPGRICLVTGSTGIAAAAAALLAARGARIFVTSRTADHARALAETIAADGGEAGWLAADLAEADEVAAVIDACLAAYGRIDGLLAVAGGSGRRLGDGPVHEVSAEAWEATIRLNLTTQALIAGAVARRMLGQDPIPGVGRGSIVLTTSVVARHPEGVHFATHAYAAAKGGIVALMRSMAATYAGDGIRVNAIAPGLTDTPMAARAAGDPAIRAFAAARQPLSGGLLAADDIAPAAAFLLSDESRSVTGQVLAIDGGWSIVNTAPDVG